MLARLGRPRAWIFRVSLDESTVNLSEPRKADQGTLTCCVVRLIRKLLNFLGPGERERESSGRDRVINIIIVVVVVVVVEITAAQPSPSDRQSLCVRKDGSKVDSTADPPAYPTPLRRSGSCSRGKGLGVLLVVVDCGRAFALLCLCLCASPCLTFELIFLVWFLLDRDLDLGVWDQLPNCCYLAAAQPTDLRDGDGDGDWVPHSLPVLPEVLPYLVHLSEYLSEYLSEFLSER
ncbi:uncharacterized protein CCOS01_15877 [Colletotrichum costaricense]|uniref:Uncharacterized protein n=1 Tax=Colletotrichum costaricense TaxID=1209916 RepID=A0AAI9YGI1_9PEZI|nr:uncharacterized protein CCOS01_15877 [Colletotrichum costaricense]KAK1508216.1 hypothetical protein CCOS01_15877 [Colletotrichum costaricense]